MENRTTPLHYCYAIFDLDGTLDNQMPNYTRAFVSVCKEKGIPEKGLAESYANTAGTPLHQQFRNVLGNNGTQSTVESAVTRFWQLVDKNENPNLFPGARELIRSFYTQGKQLYIITGTETSQAQRRLRKMDLQQYFTLILGQSEGLEKGPQHLHRMQEQSQDTLFFSRAFYIGDGPADMRYAKEHGILAIGITNTLPAEKLKESGAEHIIERLEQVLPLLERLELSNHK
ncbi:HAD-IA family hydrolase [Candidatus Woesearchaeota archaeon]|nr:HAD-IA family hydrolase [Candidatus Woesearchaeota archaeon]